MLGAANQRHKALCPLKHDENNALSLIKPSKVSNEVWASASHHHKPSLTRVFYMTETAFRTPAEAPCADYFGMGETCEVYKSAVRNVHYTTGRGFKYGNYVEHGLNCSLSPAVASARTTKAGAQRQGTIIECHATDDAENAIKQEELLFCSQARR
ncbi:hypothetical protein LTR95_009272 [Oleoguttula sp. CCFEE 5521]